MPTAALAGARRYFATGGPLGTTYLGRDWDWGLGVRWGLRLVAVPPRGCMYGAGFTRILELKGTS